MAKDGEELEKTRIHSKWVGGYIEQVMLLRESLSNSYLEDKSFYKTALNQLNASAVLAMLCQQSHGEEHLSVQDASQEDKLCDTRFLSKGTWNDDTGVVNELAV